MSRKQELEQSIIDQCLNPDSLLLLLRGNEFDEGKYNSLMNAIHQYHQLIAEDKVISRRVAGCLRVFEQVLEGSVTYYQRQPAISDGGRRISAVWEEVWDLMNEIFDIGDE